MSPQQRAADTNSLREQLEEHDNRLVAELQQLRATLGEGATGQGDATPRPAPGVAARLDELCRIAASANLARDALVAGIRTLGACIVLAALIMSLSCLLWLAWVRNTGVGLQASAITIYPGNAEGRPQLEVTRWQADAPFVQSKTDVAADCTNTDVRLQKGSVDLGRAAAWHLESNSAAVGNLAEYLGKRPRIVLVEIEAGHDALEIKPAARDALVSNRDLAVRRAEFIRSRIAEILAERERTTAAGPAPLPTVVVRTQAARSERPERYCEDRTPHLTVFAETERSAP